MSYDLQTQPGPPTWLVCYVKPLKDGGMLVFQGGVAWWGWEKGDLGDPTLVDFWVRDYRTDRQRERCGVNCTRYGLARRLKANSSCYHVRQNWTTASHDDFPTKTSKPKDGWLDRAYCMRPILSPTRSMLFRPDQSDDLLDEPKRKAAFPDGKTA